MEIKQGIFELSNHEYHYGILKKVLGSSGISKLRISPEHYKAYINEAEKPPTPSLRFGDAYHVYTLERSKFNDRVAIAPAVDRRTKAGKATWAEFEEKAKGKTIISNDDMIKIRHMAEAMSRLTTAGSIFKHKGHFERVVLWEDPTYGFMCKARPDFEIPELNLIIDLKTAESADRWRFAKSIANYNYDLSAAWYIGGMKETTGRDYSWLWLVQEKDPPFSAAIYMADQEILDNGRAKIRPALELYADCLEKDTWPGYPDEVQTIKLPGWALEV